MDRSENEEGDDGFEDDIAMGAPVPWESDEPADPPRQRHDAFNGLRKRTFLKALAKTGCVRDGARVAGVSTQTVYTHQQDDREFAHHCELALQMAAADIELMAWERGVVGIEEERVYAGKVVGTRIKRSDSILRLLLQGADRKKYGPRPGFSRKRLLKHERKQIEREVQAEWVAKRPTFDQVRGSILKKVEAITGHRNRERIAAGWTALEDGIWIPPGWVKVGDDGAEGVSKNDDSV